MTKGSSRVAVAKATCLLFAKATHGMGLALGTAALLISADLAAGEVPDAKPAAVAPDFSGVWQVARYQRSIRTLEGKVPPLKPEAKQIYEQNLITRKQLKPRSDMSRCVPPGVPRVMWAPRPVMILQTPRKITFVHEYQHLLRHIYMNEPLPPADDLDPTYMGESRGKWDGDTLVVETTGLNDKTLLDRDGMPHSASLHVTERLRLIDGGKRLEDRVQIDDPETFLSSWTARVVFERKPGAELSEYNCVLKYEEF